MGYEGILVRQGAFKDTHVVRLQRASAVSNGLALELEHGSSGQNLRSMLQQSPGSSTTLRSGFPLVSIPL